MQISIDGKICDANEGEYILNIARREGIFIPALCYLSGCSPTLACRLCMVEADGKRVYSCNAKIKDGMSVITHTDEIEREREAIMQTYCINHPLQCGVCDKSGECELQNFTAKMRVNSQNYTIKDTHKPVKNWGLISYDPSLCIVCERCITVCKDKIGESALKTIPRGGDQVPKELKERMPKDAFAVWSKFQKSLIAPSVGEMLECSFCGECTSVCPVGALVSSDFKYTSNAWELHKIPASNPHFSDCELIFYEVKPKGISDRSERIYRVSNDFNFGEISTATRYGFDFHNENATKNETKFNEIVNKIKNGEIKNIKFNSFITNEEAFILELLRKKFDLNLINDEALAYQKFLDEFSKFSGETLYNGNYENIAKADFIVVAGTFLRHDSPNTSYKINNALTINKASGFYFHPLGDKVVSKYSKNFDTITHKVGQEEQILLFLLQKFGENLPNELKNKLDKFRYKNNQDIADNSLQNDQDLENLSKVQNDENFKSVFAKELGLDEARFDVLSEYKQNLTLIIGADFYASLRWAQLARLVGLVQKYTKFRLILIPPRTNSLGVAKICTLSHSSVLNEPNSGKTLGYNEQGDFKFSIFGGDIDAGALNQQEGTFVSINKVVVPTNAALSHNGYFLNDLANVLGLNAHYTIEYTPKLPRDKGFKPVEFDKLSNFYDNGGVSYRGYELENLKFVNGDKISDMLNFDINLNTKTKNQNDTQTIQIYRANPIALPSKMANHTRLLGGVGALYASGEFMDKFELCKDEVVIVKNGDISLAISVKLDTDISGEWAYLGDFDDKILTDEVFNGSRFTNVQIQNIQKADIDE
ncbi:NADH-quinone oxidoreductase subunit G [Campylobacter sp. faydin G-24]|uniref:NADH-quinone oxidoreductase subunit G n=1 Tax=Campylobacter anatolicus TaxID=2829105 RepID=A0ABS5HI13_9BACT|nr:NADH-quinone oxidoreductase subunit G [Campylobacter anatolicus]MBR8463227.1 NADH-quinone oxidoreductase subunit G [Campylobacter anatolicus]